MFAVMFSIFDLSVLAAQEVNPLMARLQQKMADAGRRDRAEYSGRDRALLCSYCHGEDGNSLKPEVPNLAGQNPGYLLEQIGRFARGERKDYVMNSLAAKFTEDDQINLAIYYATKKVKVSQYDQGLASQGKKLYRQNCQACHGKTGMGNPGFARLAGQKPAYIKRTLSRFRASAQQQINTTKRRSPIMEPIASRLSEQEIGYLAAYIAGLR